jgi:hypothetical protein
MGEDAGLEAVMVVDAYVAEPATAIADMFEVDLLPDVAERGATSTPSPCAS